MSEHKVTENILNAGFQRSATLSCSCGLSIDVANIRKLPLSAARRQLTAMHENLTAPKPKKKSKKEKPVDTNDTGETYESESTITPSHESLTIDSDTTKDAGGETFETETNVHGDDDWATPKTNDK